jgi:hypothetical protein
MGECHVRYVSLVQLEFKAAKEHCHTLEKFCVSEAGFR